jgi:capsular exopolysaccharide synthesis family protein
MEIRTFVAPLLKWWWLILLAAALAGVSSYYTVRNEPEIYQARSTLMAGRPFDNPNPEGNQFYLSQQLASTYAEIAKREPVRRATEAALGLERLPDYDVGVPAQAQLIEITVTDTNPERAQAVANELANQLVLLSPGSLAPDKQEMAAFVDKQLTDLAEQIERTQDEILLLEGQLGELFSAREIAATQDQIAALQNKLSVLQTNYTSFLANSQEEAINVLTIIEPAPLPRRAIGPNKPLIIAMSMALGIVVAAGAAYALEYIDDSIESEEDIRQAVGLPTLSSLEKNGDFDTHPVWTIKSPRSPLAEAFRDLRTRVLFLSLNKPYGTILITSANANAGKSFTSSNLAVVMAQAGYRTVLVDADLRRPRQHEIFNLSNNVGLSNLIMEGNIVDQRRIDQDPKPLAEVVEHVVQETSQGGLYVLTSGTIPPNPSELIGSTGMISVIEALREEFDFIVLDSSPLVVTDSLLLATLSDSVILVSSAKDTRGKNLKKATARLKEVDANLIGVVLNRVPRSVRGAYNYYQSYGLDESLSKGKEGQEESRGNGFRKRIPWFSAETQSNNNHTDAESSKTEQVSDNV